ADLRRYWSGTLSGNRDLDGGPPFCCWRERTPAFSTRQPVVATLRLGPLVGARWIGFHPDHGCRGPCSARGLGPGCVGQAQWLAAAASRRNPQIELRRTALKRD